KPAQLESGLQGPHQRAKDEREDTRDGQRPQHAGKERQQPPEHDDGGDNQRDRPEKREQRERRGHDAPLAFAQKGRGRIGNDGGGRKQRTSEARARPELLCGVTEFSGSETVRLSARCGAATASAPSPATG